MRVFIAVCAVLIMSACVGNTVPNPSASPVQNGLWKTENYRVAGANTGLLIINRDAGMRGSACIPGILLNGELIAPVNIGEKLELHVPAGRHLLRATPNSNCAAKVAETSIEIGQAQTTTYRLGFAKREMILIPTAN